MTAVNRYDEYGQPQGGALTGRFGYTGQAWLAEAGLYYYKARMYNPALGRFLQPDPIGYAGGMNLYAYVGNDPVNLTDPLGLQGYPATQHPPIPPIVGRTGWDSAYLGALALLQAMQTVAFIPSHMGENRPLPGPAPEPQSDQKTLSQCMVNFLNRAAPGTDWGAVRLTEGSTWGGRRASTSLNLVTYRAWRYSTDFSLLLHELGHMPDWQSGELTNVAYARESASAGWNGRDTWAGNRFEQNANLFEILVDDSYREAGSPCDGNIFSQ